MVAAADCLVVHLVSIGGIHDLCDNVSTEWARELGEGGFMGKGVGGLEERVGGLGGGEGRGECFIYPEVYIQVTCVGAALAIAHLEGYGHFVAAVERFVEAFS